MTVVRAKGGYKIRSHKTGKLYPKLYKSKKAAKKRIGQMQKWKHAR